MAKFINVGYENNVNVDKVVAVLNSNSAQGRRLIKNAKEKDLLIEATEGNKTLSILVIENGQVIKSAVKAETLRKRCDK